MNCCICGPVKNCAPYLRKIFDNIEKIGSLFDDYKIVIFYDKSNDNTLDILKEYQLKNSRLLFYVNEKPTSPFRTHNIAYARNHCLSYIRQNVETFPYFIMMDFDDVNCKEINLQPIKNALCSNDWDGLSFNTKGGYYDIWALSIRPYYFSYLHFKQRHFYNFQTFKDYINNLLEKVPKNSLLKCLSSFNGFAIYRTNFFLDTYYDGRIRIDLIPDFFIKQQSRLSRSKLIFHKYEHVNGYFEDCEHRAFHLQAIKNSGAKIRISPEIIFY